MSSTTRSTRLDPSSEWLRLDRGSMPEAGAVMAQARSENFPVASLVLPRRLRLHLLAVYGFARLVDDIGDEAPGDRLALLAELEADLERIWEGGAPGNPLIARLRPTVEACALPIEPFRALVEANRRDQLVERYESYEQLLGYCALSANPVGELVLRIFGLATRERLALSGKVCTALQLVEHWQDVREDARRGRIYLPREDRERFGVEERDLVAASATRELRSLIEFEVARTRRLLDEGKPLVFTLRGRPALAVAGFLAGGRAAVRAIERAGYDVLATRAHAGAAGRLRELLGLLVEGATR